MTHGDHRTVGELLLDSEFLARDVLTNPARMDGRAMLRTWGEVVESAGELWETLPGGADPMVANPPDAEDALMGRLQSMNSTLMRNSRGPEWPGEGPADERFLTISGNLIRAAELVQRYRSDVTLTRAPVHADLAAAKARLMHTLYIGAHGVHVAIGQDLRALQDGRSAGLATIPLTPVRAARDRLASFEAIAGSYVSRTYPAALRDEHRSTPELNRVSNALATWEIQTHRTLATSISGANLMAITQTHAWVLMASQRLLHAAAETGAIDKDQFKERLSPALEAAQAGWGNLATTWQNLTPPSAQRIAPNLVGATHETRAALLELVHDRTGPASATTIATRADLVDIAQTLQQTISASVDLAHGLLAASGDTTLTVWARAALTMSTELGSHRPQNSADPIEAAVDANDVVGNRQISLPDPIRGALEQQAQRVVDTSTYAARAAATLDRATEISQTSPERMNGRSHERRAPSRALVPNQRGCER